MEDFVTFETAKKLKEKGFNEVCYNHYEPLKHCLNKIKTPWTNKDGESCGVITAPTISQVLKWLRDEKKIAINIEFIPYVWQYKIFDMSFKSRFEPFGLTLFSDYEEAALAGIEYVIDNLI